MAKAKRITGNYVKATTTGEEVAAFIPFPLPPKNPQLDLNETVQNALNRVEHSLTQLEQAGEMVPSLDWFIYAFVRKEAVTSAQIEGTQATLLDLLTYESYQQKHSTPSADIEEICNYLDALKFARRELHRKKGLPLSVRLLNKIHKRLMKGVRGGTKQPGEIRRSQNWIGGTRPGNAIFVPPPPHLLGDCLKEFEKYIHAEDKLPPLIRIAILHAHFETIHPYLDGNGRVGRLLITLLLEHWYILKQPLLYLSLFFKRHRSEYYRLLNAIRTEGDWEAWVKFFLEGVATIADEAQTLAHELFSLVTHDRQKLLSAKDTTVIALRLFEQLPLHPMVSMSQVVHLLHVTKPTAMKVISILEKLNILVEFTGRKRDRIFTYSTYLDKLCVGTELSVALK